MDNPMEVKQSIETMLNVVAVLIMSIPFVLVGISYAYYRIANGGRG